MVTESEAIFRGKHQKLESELKREKKKTCKYSIVHVHPLCSHLAIIQITNNFSSANLVLKITSSHEIFATSYFREFRDL